MSLKQRLQRMERTLGDQSLTFDQQALMDRFTSEYAKGRILCRDGVSLPFDQWLIERHPEIKPQLQEICYQDALKAMKQGKAIDPEDKQFLMRYLRELTKEKRKEIAKIEKQILEAGKNDLRPELKKLREEKSYCDSWLREIDELKTLKTTRKAMKAE